MANLGLWRDERYIQRKSAALARDPRHTHFTWISAVKKRELMLDCVLKFVRGRLPSPNGEYMGHMWE